MALESPQAPLPGVGQHPESPIPHGPMNVLGDVGGGMRVNLTGRDFVDYGDVRCRFGTNAWTRATVIGEGVIRSPRC